MPPILINQKLYPELKKVNINTKLLDSLNRELIKELNVLPEATPIVGMSLADADNVVRWTIDFSLGLVGGPTRKNFLWQEVDLIPDPLAPIIGVDYGSVINPNPLNPIATGGIPAARGLLESATVSSFLSAGPTPQLVKTLQRQGDFRLSTRSISLARGIVIGSKDLPLLPNNQEDQDQPGWKIIPDLYWIPLGYPMTEAEELLSIYTLRLINKFGQRTRDISSGMTEVVRKNLPNWRLPNHEGVDFSSHEARLEYLKGCDAALGKAEQECLGIIQDSMTQLLREGHQFLLGTHSYIYATPKIFEDYLEGQSNVVLNTAFTNYNRFVGHQRKLVDTLKTQLANYDFQAEQARVAAEEANKKQGINCQWVSKQPFFWVTVVVFGPLALPFWFPAQPPAWDPNEGPEPPYTPDTDY